MQFIALILYLVFLAFGVYLYLFSIGGFRQKSTPNSAAEAFREENKGWLKIASLALMAIMFVNALLEIMSLL